MTEEEMDIAVKVAAEKHPFAKAHHGDFLSIRQRRAFVIEGFAAACESKRAEIEETNKLCVRLAQKHDLEIKRHKRRLEKLIEFIRDIGFKNLLNGPYTAVVARELIEEYEASRD